MLIFKNKINRFVLLPMLGLWLACAIIRIINKKLPVWEDTSYCKGIYPYLCTKEPFKDSLLLLNCWDGFLPVLVLLILLVLWFTGSKSNYKKHLVSYKWHKQLFGALFNSKLEYYINPIVLFVTCLAYYSWKTKHIFFLKILL